MVAMYAAQASSPMDLACALPVPLRPRRKRAAKTKRTVSAMPAIQGGMAVPVCPAKQTRTNYCQGLHSASPVRQTLSASLTAA